ncbi:RNA polymerase sigma factor [Sporosarcina saromensis]|uniref:RNA polymerase sigma factor n=1 Tax=Sporosarcina saromensis TaxID=359365 RepID=A0ABU4GE73_9BACL|nr:RNA polymerase sigma factor [Sporosarcina saromensis]MDW0115257.1 RNA polymerase sigma factor [Sporosarcina saromensis]
MTNREQWFHNHFNQIYSYILLLVNDAHTAEDLTQETFLKAMKHEQTFKGQSSVKTWLFRIAYTTTISYFRNKQPLTHFLDTALLRSKHDLSPEETTLLNAQQKEFYAALQRLKPSYQQVIVLRKIQEFSTLETATILAWTEGKVKMSLSRALVAFKKELEKGGFTNETLFRR